MSALSTPGGGGTTAQSKPTSGKQKYQKLDINSLYCANRSESSEPSSVKSQLSRKHGMQSLGKVPSARRPPANLPSLKTETGQDTNTNAVSATTNTNSTPATCTPQTTTQSPSSGAAVGVGPGGWVALPPPTSPHFRTEFPSLEASAQPSHRSDHTPPQLQLRPQTEGSWTSGGTAGSRAEQPPPTSATPAAGAAQTPALRAILPSFLTKGSSGGGGAPGLSTLGGAARETRSPAPRAPSRAAPPPRAAVEVLTPRPILRDEQISSLDDISRDAGWAMQDDIDYDQKLDFSDGESSAPSGGSRNKSNNNRAAMNSERLDAKLEPGDEEQMWAERRQKQNNEVAQVVARARLLKEEEQRRQMRDPPSSGPNAGKDSRDRLDRDRDRVDRDRNDRDRNRQDRNRDRSNNRDRERIEPRDRDRMDNRDRDHPDTRDRERVENRDRERPDNRERDRPDNRERDRIDNRERETRDKERNDNRERIDNRERDRGVDSRDRDRVENRDRDRTDNRERDRLDNRDSRERLDNRDRNDSRDKDRTDVHRDRNDNRERIDRDRPERERERMDRERDRPDRDRGDRNDRERTDRDRDRERVGERDSREFRDREYNREQPNSASAFSKTFQSNIPPRFLKQQQSRQQEDQHSNKGWAFTGKPAPRRPEPAYNPPRQPPHNGRRSYSRDYSDREDEFRRDKEGSGPQWRSEMQDYDRPGREFERQSSKDSYKEYGEHRRNESDRKSSESITGDHRTSAAEKLSEVFDRKSASILTPQPSDPVPLVSSTERRHTPPANLQRDSAERDFGLASSWAEASQEAHDKEYPMIKPPQEKVSIPKTEKTTDFGNEGAGYREQRSLKDPIKLESDDLKHSNFGQQSLHSSQPPRQTSPPTAQHNSSNLGLHNKFQTSSMQGNPQQALQNCNINVQAKSHNSITSSMPANNLSQPFNTSGQTLNQAVHPQDQSISQFQTPNSNQLLLHSDQYQPLQGVGRPVFSVQPKLENEPPESESLTLKPNLDINIMPVVPNTEINLADSASVSHSAGEGQKRPSSITDDKRLERFSTEQLKQIENKEPVERKSSGSGSEKKGRGYGGYAVYGRGWGARESRGRRSHRSSHSNRASESDGSTDGALNPERKERRRAPRSPRGPKKTDRVDDVVRVLASDQALHSNENMENREAFAPRGQPSRRGRGGFQGASRPPAPAKRVTGYGPPNTKSPFGQATRAVKDTEDNKDHQQGDEKAKNKQRTGSSTGRPDLGRGRDRRNRGVGPTSGEDENWETTSEHSDGGGAVGRRRSLGARQPGAKGVSGQDRRGQQFNQGRVQNPAGRQNSGNTLRNGQVSKKDVSGDGRVTDVTEGMSDLKMTASKKDANDEVVDDGFQEVRNKKTSKEPRSTLVKEEPQMIPKQQRSQSNQGGGRNGSSTRSSSEKSASASRGSAPVPPKSGTQYDRQRLTNLAPRFMKQKQKQQMGLISSFGPDTGAAPPPPAVNAWDKPIAQSLRGNTEETIEVVENKSGHSSQRSTPGAVVTPEIKAAVACSLAADKTGVLDGATPPVETIIFENTNYKTAPPAEALKQKFQPIATSVKALVDEVPAEIDARTLSFNGDVRQPPRSIQELIAENGRPISDADAALGLQMSFEAVQKGEDSADMKLDFAFDSDLGQLTEDKTGKALGLQRNQHNMAAANAISPLAADLNLKIASVKKVWEMPAVVEGAEELQFAGFEEGGGEAGAPPNVCKVKPTQQLQSPPPQHYNHVGYQGGYGGLSVPSPPAVLFNSSQQLLGSSQQLQQQGGLYGAFLDQSRGQFGGFPGTHYGAGSGPYNYHSPPDMFQSLPSQYRMAANNAAFGQSGQLGNSPSTVLISSSSNSLMSATVKPSSQQIGAIGSKGGGVAAVGGVGGVNTAYGAQQYLGYTAPVDSAAYSLPGLLPRPAPPTNSYYSPYQPQTAPAPTYPLQFGQPAQSGAFGSQFLSSPLQVAAAAAVQQMQQYRGPLQQQYAPPRPPPQQLKSPLHEHANGFAPLCDAASPSPKPMSVKTSQKPPHSPPHHKFHQPPPSHTPHQHQQHPQHQQHQQMMNVGNSGRSGGGQMGRAPPAPAQRYPAPIQRPHAPAQQMYRQAPPHPQRAQHVRPPPYYHHHQPRNGGCGSERGESADVGAGGGERADDGGGEERAPAIDPPPADPKPE